MIVVVGAGLAGLTYAYRAVKNGEKVEVWEKDHYLGLKPCGEAVLDGFHSTKAYVGMRPHAYHTHSRAWASAHHIGTSRVH